LVILAQFKLSGRSNMSLTITVFVIFVSDLYRHPVSGSLVVLQFPQYVDPARDERHPHGKAPDVL
jgi:hypothetical protein